MTTKTTVSVVLVMASMFAAYSGQRQARTITNVAHNVEIYQGKSGLVLQTLAVVQISASKIAFAVISNNSATNKSSRLIGIAARSPDTDPEISEDALGNSYPSLDFYYEDNCFLHINIELAHHDNATISESKCSDKRDGTTPFATDSSLHRIRRP